MKIVVYDIAKMPYSVGDFLITYADGNNCKPSVGDNLIINNVLYNVKSVDIDYQVGEIWVFVKAVLKQARLYPYNTVLS